MELDCGGKPLDLSAPRVMGVLNITPDSFSDGGRFLEPQAAIDQAMSMCEQGAALIDVGGESTRPGAQPVSVQQELDRVLPVIETVAPHLSVPISIDTSKPEVMLAAVAAGAGMINDVCSLTSAGAIEAAKDCAVPICLMHMQGEPRTMQQAPSYTDVVSDIRDFLAARMLTCETAGIPRQRLLLDPGFGFGKTLQHNLQLLAHLDAFSALGLPLLVGLSRKRMFGQLLGREVRQRLAASLAAALLAGQHGAKIIRVHDVAETVDVLAVLDAVQHCNKKEMG